MPKEAPNNDAVRLKFVDALDAWVKVEHALWQVFYVILKPLGAARSQSLFHAVGSFQSQRDAVMVVAHGAISDTDLLDELETLQARARGLGTKRNNLVHGRWMMASARWSDPNSLMRFYRPANIHTFLKPGETLLSKKGKYVFDLKDLVNCEREFTTLAKDYDAIRMKVAAHLNVSPHIEIGEEEIVGAIRTTILPSGPPQGGN
jgi:hypothetical protein